MGLESVEDVQLLIRAEGHELLDHFGRIGAPDEAGDVNINEGGHEVLAVESVHDASVTWDGVGKVLDFEGPLKAAGEEPSERPHDGGEGGESNAVDLERVKLHCAPSSD